GRQPVMHVGGIRLQTEGLEIKLPSPVPVALLDSLSCFQTQHFDALCYHGDTPASLAGRIGRRSTHPAQIISLPSLSPQPEIASKVRLWPVCPPPARDLQLGRSRPGTEGERTGMSALPASHPLRRLLVGAGLLLVAAGLVLQGKSLL